MLEDPGDYGGNCVQNRNNPVFVRLFSPSMRPGECNHCLNGFTRNGTGTLGAAYLQTRRASNSQSA